MNERRRFLIPEEGNTRMTEMEIESQKPPKKRAGRKALAVAASLMAASAAQAGERRWIPSGGEVLRTVSDVQRTRSRHQETMADIEARKQRDRQINEERKAQIEARKQEQLAREKTRRQEAALRNAESAGWTGVNVKSTEDETDLNVTAQGTTPPERMQADQHIHDETMAQIEAARKRAGEASQKLAEASQSQTGQPSQPERR